MQLVGSLRARIHTRVSYTRYKVTTFYHDANPAVLLSPARKIAFELARNSEVRGARRVVQTMPSFKRCGITLDYARLSIRAAARVLMCFLFYTSA